MSNYKALLPYIVREWRWLCIIAGLTAVSCLTGALQPWPIKLLVDHAIGGRELPELLARPFGAFSMQPNAATLLVVCVGAVIVIGILNSAVTSAMTWAWTVTGQRMVARLGLALFARLQRASFRFHQKRSLGDSLSRLTGDTWCVYTLAGQVVGPVHQALTLSTVGVVAWHLNHTLATLSISAAPLLGLSSIHFGRRLKAKAKKGRQAQTQLLAFVHQTLSSIPIVQAFGAEERNTRSFHGLAAEAVTISQRSALVSSAYGLTNGLISATAAAIVVFVGGREVLAGRLTVGGLLVFLAYLRTLQGAAEGLLKAYGALKPVEASIERVQEVLATDDCDVREAPRTTALPSAGTLSVRFENVTFGYEPERAVLQDITFEAVAGELIGVVGTTGAGKSTLVSLIPRFADVWNGAVRIGGVDVRELSVEELRRAVAVLYQDPYLFPISIAENIRYGRLDADNNAVRRAATLANADRFIRRFPEGYETVLGSQGATLSGGERQRLAIARALVKEARLLILDEPSSALDAQTESGLIESLRRFRQGRTTFVIAHRLSTIRDADRILVIENGRLVELGSHAELIRADGVYARLWEAQTGAAVGAA